MRKSKQTIRNIAEETTSPPDALPAGHAIARVARVDGHSLYEVEYAEMTLLHRNLHKPEGDDGNDENKPSPAATPRQLALVELAPRFRNTIWLKVGSYVVVNREAFADRKNKLDGEIVNVVRDERAWRRMTYWPPEFVKRPEPYQESDASDEEDEENVVGMMPPRDEEEKEGDEGAAGV